MIKMLFPGLTVLVAALLLLPACSPPTAAKTTYAIGDIGPSGAGIVFYITNGGLHGLEAATSDQSTGFGWITGGSTQTTLNGNTSGLMGTGLANSNAITAQAGHTSSAAQSCRNYTGGGKTDWFLPSQAELVQLYNQKTVIGGFADQYYWSSSEGDASNAWYVNFFNGGEESSSKGATGGNTRAVRSF